MGQNDAPIGSGPFKLRQWERGSYVDLIRNPNYFRPGLPHLDRVIIRSMPDRTARELAFERGEVNFLYAYIVPIERIADFSKNPNFRVFRGGLGVATNTFMLMNTQAGPLATVKVRQALAYAIDRDYLTKVALFDQGKVARSFIGSAVKWAFTDRYDVYKRNLDKADQLLTEAGFPPRTGASRFSLRLVKVPGTPANDRAAEIIRSNLKDVGIDVVIEDYDNAAYLDRVFAKFNFDLVLQPFTTGPDPTISVPLRYRKATIGQPYANAMRYQNDEYEKLINEEYKITNTAQRAKVWYQIQQILMSDLPALPLFEFPDIELMSSKFCDVVHTGDGYLGSRQWAYETTDSECR
jgi:peptide/nickel transport system substrate-binding protein